MFYGVGVCLHSRHADSAQNYQPFVGNYPLHAVYVMVIVFLGCIGLFICLRTAINSIYSTGASVRKVSHWLQCMHSPRQDTTMPFTVAVLTSWDFSMTTAEPIASLNLAIKSTLLDLIHEATQHDTHGLTPWQLRRRRIVAWMLSGAFMGGSFAV